MSFLVVQLKMARSVHLAEGNIDREQMLVPHPLDFFECVSAVMLRHV